MAPGKFFTPTKHLRHLAVLLAIHQEPKTSQHDIARRAGISSALVNGYVKFLISDGLISTRKRNHRDQDYSLTRQGEQMLSALLLDYSTETVQIYAQAKQAVAQRLADIFRSADQLATIVLYGAADTCELILGALTGIPEARVIGIVDSSPEKQGTSFHNFTVMPAATIAPLSPAFVIITSFAKQNEIYQDIKHLEENDITILRFTVLGEVL